ncbi:Alpha/beta hydrolase fold-3 [Talaromyces proteolyticus]|uniref:Alpha/beta hydrolase fold-3 n=1 Tax=Talaromyces proteolyticus TaxID=1131652 RepID=A0AAD4PWJ5_9EURO|nr:Alpha/beta hydrolase fold-3 [Talaromyces proteolyticus]KAH8692582.1 Alpha/beta hydrolase fold-3 [Talaromyces proteolyticus]
MAPEFPYPTAIIDVWESLNWVLNHSNELQISRSRIILGGSSAGANLAAVVTRKAISNSIPISGTLLQIPVVCHRNCYPSEEYELLSMHQNKDAPMLSKAALDQFWAYYNPPDITDLQVSPLLAKDFTGFPQTFIQVCGLDPLRDEGLAYARKLWGFDVPCSVVVYPGFPHGFSAFTELSAARAYREDMLNGLNGLISGEITSGVRNYHGK